MVEHPHAPAAHWRYGLTSRDGRTRWSSWIHNRVQRDYAHLVGALLAQTGPAGPTGISPATFQGASYLAVGQGSASWDTIGTPTPSDVQTLTGETRIACQMLGWRQPDGSITAPTLVGGGTSFRGPIFTATWNAPVPTPTREVALFGGTASASLGTGQILSYVNFAVLTATAADPTAITWEIEWTLTWS